MSRDYKRSDRGSGSRGGGSLLVGILIGLVLGLGIALAIAWYVNKMPSPFLARAPAPAKEEAAKGAAPAPRGEEPAAKGESRTRFDFYKILPGAEESASETRKEARAGPAAPAREVFYLQAGAFQSAPDADSLKARLALLGIEATIQTTTLADRGVWHRVRIGPYTSVEELNRTRETLQRNGVETSLIRVREGGVE